LLASPFEQIMNNQKYKEEFKKIEDALQNEQSRLALKIELKPLVESIADKYATHESTKEIPRSKLIQAGWANFDFALKKYKEAADLMLEGKKDAFYFNTYFTWYIRQGIVEYLNSLK